MVNVKLTRRAQRAKCECALQVHTFVESETHSFFENEPFSTKMCETEAHFFENEQFSTKIGEFEAHSLSENEPFPTTIGDLGGTSFLKIINFRRKIVKLKRTLYLKSDHFRGRTDGRIDGRTDWTHTSLTKREEMRMLMRMRMRILSAWSRVADTAARSASRLRCSAQAPPPTHTYLI